MPFWTSRLLDRVRPVPLMLSEPVIICSDASLLGMEVDEPINSVTELPGPVVRFPMNPWIFVIEQLPTEFTVVLANNAGSVVTVLPTIETPDPLMTMASSGFTEPKMPRTMCTTPEALRTKFHEMSLLYVAFTPSRSINSSTYST